MVRAQIHKGRVRPLHIHVFDTSINQGGSMFGDALRFSKEFDNFELMDKDKIIGIIPIKWLTNN